MRACSHTHTHTHTHTLSLSQAGRNPPLCNTSSLCSSVEWSHGWMWACSSGSFWRFTVTHRVNDGLQSVNIKFALSTLTARVFHRWRLIKIVSCCYNNRISIQTHIYKRHNFHWARCRLHPLKCYFRLPRFLLFQVDFLAERRCEHFHILFLPP